LRAYIPEKLTGVYVVAIVYGLFIGGFLGGVGAAGYEPITSWLVGLGVVAGAFVGVIIALSIVHKGKA
jgi:hypothetical protein